LKLTANQIAESVDGKVVGNNSAEISKVAKIEEADNSSLCFISNKKYLKHLKTTQAGIVLVGSDVNEVPKNVTVVQCAQPYVAFCHILIQYFQYQDPNKGIHATAVIETSASIGEGCYVGPNAYIGENVSLGSNSKVYANTSIYENCSIGDNTSIYSNCTLYYESVVGSDCIIHSGTVIGSDGFGHAPLPDGTYIKIPQIGNVVIKNNVEIGSNCSIDRANMGSTLIEEGCRIDNLIQIAHGVQIGKYTVVAAQTGISGSSKVGDHCVLAGQVGVAGHITIANKVQIGAQSGVSNNIREEGGKFTDSPHLPLGNALKSRVLYKNLPQLEKRVRDIEQQLKTDN